MQRRRLIVGIDPGTTSAFAAFDLSGRFVASWSKRDAGKEELVAAIREAGDPLIIACDVAVAPAAVVKIAAAFNAKLFSPNYDLRESEKKGMTSNWKFVNVHELDAAAGALKALHFYGNLLRKTERVARENKLEAKVAEMQALALSGVKLEEAVEALVDRKLEYEIVEKTGGARRLAEENAKKDERIRELLGAVAELRKSIERLEAEKREMAHKLMLAEKGVLDRAKKDSEIRKRDAEILRLRNLIFSVKEAKRLELQTRAKAREDRERLDLDKLVDEHRTSRKYL